MQEPICFLFFFCFSARFRDICLLTLNPNFLTSHPFSGFFRFTEMANAKDASPSATTTSDYVVVLGNKIGKGAYGSVFAAEYRNTKTGQGVPVAVKICTYTSEEQHVDKDRPGQLGLPAAGVREGSFYAEFGDHPSIVRVYAVTALLKEVRIVMEQMPTNLHEWIQKTVPRDLSIIRSFLRMCLEGLVYLHSNQIMHRDIKPQNILVCPTRKIAKLADFGLARRFLQKCDDSHSGVVVTLWYRSIELLLGDNIIGEKGEADIWAMGCVFYEMLRGRALFATRPKTAGKEETEVDTTEAILQLLGMPSQQDWKDVEKLPKWKAWNLDRFANRTKQPWKPLLPHVPDVALDLLDKMLAWPQQRPCAQDLLKHEFFSDETILALKPPGHG